MPAACSPAHSLPSSPCSSCLHHNFLPHSTAETGTGSHTHTHTQPWAQDTPNSERIATARAPPSFHLPFSKASKPSCQAEGTRPTFRMGDLKLREVKSLTLTQLGNEVLGFESMLAKFGAVPQPEEKCKQQSREPNRLKPKPEHTLRSRLQGHPGCSLSTGRYTSLHSPRQPEPCQDPVNADQSGTELGSFRRGSVGRGRSR